MVSFPGMKKYADLLYAAKCVNSHDVSDFYWCSVLNSDIFGYILLKLIACAYSASVPFAVYVGEFDVKSIILNRRIIDVVSHLEPQVAIVVAVVMAQGYR